MQSEKYKLVISVTGPGSSSKPLQVCETARIKSKDFLSPRINILETNDKQTACKPAYQLDQAKRCWHKITLDKKKMPTILAIDSSVSMSCNVINVDEPDVLSRSQLTQTCAIKVLEHLSTQLQLEHVAVLSFSSQVEQVCDFTRNHEILVSSLDKISVKDRCCFSTLVSHINNLVIKEWSCMEFCKIIVLTDGRIMWPPEGTSRTGETLFKFPSEIFFVCVESLPTLTSSGCLECLENILKENEDKGSTLSVLKPRCHKAELISYATTTLETFLTSKFSPFKVKLCCGNLKSKVVVYPAPRSRDEVAEVDDEFQVIGFLNISDLGNPPVLSRHLLLSVPDDETMKDDSKQNGARPSFSVVLHGSLKVENKAALVKVSQDSFGIVYSWSDTKTKPSLVLSLLEPGSDSVPWLGTIKHLGPAHLLQSEQAKEAETPSFPVQLKKNAKRSYAQPTVAWTRATGLQTDVQKILRSAKKLPEKSPVFYKDLNRLRRAALAFGFHELLEGISSLLERECTLLPGTAHPEATLQLSHAARELKASISKGYAYQLEPLKTDFKFNR